MDPGRQERGEQGSIAPVFLMILCVTAMMGWLLAGSTASHYVQAANRSREIIANQLAQAGVEAAIAIIDSGAVPPAALTGTEATGQYSVTITPTGMGTYRVESTGSTSNGQRGVTAEVAPRPEPFAVLSGGSVRLSNSAGVSLGSELRITGDINAAEDVELTSDGALGVGAALLVDGDVRAGGSATVTADAGVLSQATVTVDGGVGANGDLALETDAVLGAASVAVTGPVTYGGELTRTGNITISGPVTPGGGVELPQLRDADVAYYEALVADLEARGEMRQVSPGAACGTIRVHTRVTGDLSCSNLEVADGAVLVVDGTLSANTARVQGLVYVRGGSEPDPRGDISIDNLSLLEVVAPQYPAAGDGTVVGTGNIAIESGKLARALVFGPGQETVLQVLALSVGDEDERNAIDFGMGGLADALSSSRAAPLFLYAAGDGSVRIVNNTLIGAVAASSLPLIAVAGGDLSIESEGLLNLASQLRLEAAPEVWQQVPPFLQEMGRARVLSWDWTEP